LWFEPNPLLKDSAQKTLCLCDLCERKKTRKKYERDPYNSALALIYPETSENYFPIAWAL